MMAAMIRALAGQDRAVANARSAATELARSRVEREEIRHFLDQLEERRARSA